MTYNQIIKFFKENKNFNIDLYRSSADKTNENIYCLAAEIIDDGFRYEPDEDGYTIEMNSKFMHKTTKVACYYPDIDKFEDNWEEYKHDDTAGFEAQLTGYDENGKYLCTITDTSAPDIDYSGAYAAIKAVVSHKDEINKDKDSAYEVLEKVNDSLFRVDIHLALGKWNYVTNTYRAYRMEYELGETSVQDLEPAYKSGYDTYKFIAGDDTETINRILDNIRAVFKKHEVPYFGTYYIPYGNGNIARLCPLFAKPKYEISEDRWLDKPDLTESCKTIFENILRG